MSERRWNCASNLRAAAVPACLISVAAVMACGGGSATVPVHSLPALQPDEGLLAFGVQAQRTIIAIYFARDVDEMDSFTVSALPAGDNLRLLKLRAGRYCLRTIELQQAIHNAESLSTCVPVKAGVLNYPGHLVMVEGKGRGIRTPFRIEIDDKTAALPDLLRPDYPEVVRRFLH